MTAGMTWIQLECRAEGKEGLFEQALVLENVAEVGVGVDIRGRQIQSAAKLSDSSGRLPQRSASRPTAGADNATTSCGTTMQAPIRVVAHVDACRVTTPAINGSIAAFAS